MTVTGDAAALLEPVAGSNCADENEAVLLSVPSCRGLI
jgi:hypothetical protein